MIQNLVFYRSSLRDDKVSRENFIEFNDITDVEVWIRHKENDDVVYDFTDDLSTVSMLIDSLLLEELTVTKILEQRLQ